MLLHHHLLLEALACLIHCNRCGRVSLGLNLVELFDLKREPISFYHLELVVNIVLLSFVICLQVHVNLRGVTVSWVATISIFKILDPFFDNLTVFEIFLFIGIVLT